MNPENRLVKVRTSVSAKDFWCRSRDTGDAPGNVSPDGRIVSQELRPYSVLQDIPRTAPYQLQQPRRLIPLRTSRSMERLVYKTALGDADHNDTHSLAEIERLRQENQMLKNHYRAVMRINTLLTQEMRLQAQSYEELLSCQKREPSAQLDVAS